MKWAIFDKWDNHFCGTAEGISTEVEAVVKFSSKNYEWGRYLGVWMDHFKAVEYDYDSEEL